MYICKYICIYIPTYIHTHTHTHLHTHSRNKHPPTHPLSLSLSRRLASLLSPTPPSSLSDTHLCTCVFLCIRFCCVRRDTRGSDWPIFSFICFDNQPPKPPPKRERNSQRESAQERERETTREREREREHETNKKRPTTDTNPLRAKEYHIRARTYARRHSIPHGPTQ